MACLALQMSGLYVCLFHFWQIRFSIILSIKVYVSAVCSLHIEQGFPDPLLNCLRLQRVLRGVKGSQGFPAARRLLITDSLLLVIHWALDLNIFDHCTFWAACIHRIHKWQTRGKKLVPSHESEALEGKQKLQMKTFSELAECLARIPPKITLYGRLFKYNYVGCLLLLMFSIDLLFAIKRDAYIFKETG